METFISDLSKKEFPKSEKMSAQTLRAPILDAIKKHSEFGPNGSYQSHKAVESSKPDDTVLNWLKNRITLVEEIEESDDAPTLGQRLADKVASFGGSWTFILSFAGFLVIWIVVNALFLASKSFDPYPYILLNLILSTLAALQAPVIMMSQNRQEEKDRERAKKDYMINLKSELEIRMLHEKIDQLITHHQNELIDIQKVQIEMMNDIMARIGDK